MVMLSINNIDIKSLPEWQQKLHNLMQYYIEHTRAKQLGRSLRTYFLLHIAELKTIGPKWEGIVLHFIAMLELIDDAPTVRASIGLAPLFAQAWG